MSCFKWTVFVLCVASSACLSAGGAGEIRPAPSVDAPAVSEAPPPLAPTPAKSALEWTKAVRLDDASYRASRTAPGGGCVAAADGSVHAVWMSVLTKTNSEIFYRRSDDAGQTWSTSVRLVTAEGRGVAPGIAASGDQVHVVWKDKRHDDNGELYYVRSLDRGKTWSEPERLTNDEFRSSAPAISVHGDTVLIAWEDYSMNNKRSDVEVLRSTDRGATWSGRESVAPAVNGCPDFTVDARGVIHTSLCSWDHSAESRGYNYEIYYRRSKDGGVTWDPRVRLTDDRVGDSRFPIVAEGNGVVHIVWWDDRDDTSSVHEGYPPMRAEDDHNFEVYYKRSPDGGDTWEPDVRLTTDSKVGAEPTVAAHGDHVYVAWQDNRDGNYEIYFKYSQDRGATWSDDTRLTTGGELSKIPSIDVDVDGNVYLLWTEHADRGRTQVMFANAASK